MSLQRFVEKYIHVDDRHIYEKRDQQRKTPEPSEFVTRIYRADGGDIRWMRVRTFPIVEKNGNYTKSIGLVEDISEKYLLEQKLVTERSMQIQSAKMASIGVFAAGIAHEINNPLQIVKNHILSLEEIGGSLTESNEKKYSTTLETIARAMNKSVDHIASIVKSLLAYSREESTDAFTVVPFSNALDNALTMLSVQIRDKNISFQLTGISSTKVSLNCMPGQLTQVIFNILTNAIDVVEALPHRWITLDISKDEKLGSCNIRIANSGPAMDPETRKKLFLPFFTTKDINRGTGLGLFICKKIVEAHRGTLTCEEDTKHTTFSMTMPLA